MSNGKFHKSKIVKNNIEKSKNKIIYILPYNAQLNLIENLFSQIKNYVKDISPATYDELK
jgi:transposase